MEEREEEAVPTPVVRRVPHIRKVVHEVNE